VSNLSFGSGGSGASSSEAHPPHVSLLSQPGTRPGIRPVIRRRPVGGPVVDAAVFLSPFSYRHSLLGRPVPVTELNSPHGRPTAEILRTVTGFPRSTRVRCGRVGCPLNPGGDGIHATVEESSVVVCRLPAASLFVSPALLSDPESCRDEASTRVHHIHPFGLPLTCNTQSEWVPLGFSLSFAPGNYSPRTSGRGPVSDTDRELRLGHQTRPPIDVLTHYVRPRVAPQFGKMRMTRTCGGVADGWVRLGCGPPGGWRWADPCW